MNFPRRGEIFWGPGKKKIRPLLVVSNDLDNRYSNDVVVIPGTTKNVEKIYPVEVLVEGVDLSQPTKFQADSIFTILQDELGEKIARLPGPVMDKVSQALRIELYL
ncbi:type II toxin-antitoxin system PemK/MazF family toxin [Patescibacteria group bacterium]|nr:type II toxin-antitoxin system PemK/MazF family toxin [Patescibacteria group bacterium]